MFRRILVATGLMLATTAAMADTASFTVPLSDAVLTAGAWKTNPYPEIVLPNTGAPRVGFGFFLPRDYDNNKRINIRVVFRQGGPACTAYIEATSLQRGRTGMPVTFTSGLTLEGDGPATEFPDGSLVERVFSVAKSASFPGQRRGDYLFVFFGRQDAKSDDCLNILVTGIEVLYPQF